MRLHRLATEDCAVALCKPVREWKGATFKSNCLKMHARNPEMSRKSVPRQYAAGARKRLESRPLRTSVEH